MRKLIGILSASALLLAACGGSSPEPAANDDIAALEGEKKEDEKQATGDGKPGEKKKEAPKKKGGSGNGGKSQPADDGNSSGGGGGDAGGNGGGDEGQAPTTQTQAAAAPIPAGRYEYATDGKRSVSGNEESLPETTTLSAAAPSDGLQRQTRDLRDSEGNGIVTETDLLYRGGDVFISYVKITSRFQGGLTDVREFKLARPELIAPAGAGPGASRSFTMEGSGTRAKVTVKALRYEDVTVAGQKVRGLVVQTDIVFSGALEGRQRSTTWFWPKHLLPLREQVHTDVTNGPIRLQSDYEAAVRRLP